MNKQELQNEYDNIYRKKPSKWEDNQNTRNKLAFLTLYDFFKGKEPATILDIGCGNGHTIRYLSEVWKHASLYGIDLSVVAIEVAKSKKIHNATFEHLFLQDIKENHFPQFDLILVMGVMEHFEDLSAALKDIQKLLTPGGVVYVEGPNCISYPTSEPVESFRRLNIGSRQTEWHLHRDTWEKIIKDSGFIIQKAIAGPRMEYEFIWILK